MSHDNHTYKESRDHRCLQSLIEVFLYIDGQLDQNRADEITEHLNNCRECYGRIEFEKLVKGYIKTRSSNECASENVVESVSKLLEKQ